MNQSLTKQCIKCGQFKQLAGFYKHKQMKDGHLNKCKFCCRMEEWDRRHNSEKREEILAYDRKRGNRQGSDYLREYRLKNPEKYAAHQAVNWAKRNGSLVPQPCKSCGKEEAHAHHHDYNKPLDVEWLCAECHRQEHGDIEMNDVLTEPQLMDIFNCSQRKRLMQLMAEQGVRYLITRKGEPFTTMAAVNEALIGSDNAQEQVATFGRSG